MSVVSIVLTTLFVTAFVLWIGANLATTEKRLLYRPRRLYTSGDADFRRALGILLGPPLVAGNKITPLVNGAQIYPAMLNAIRTAQTNITFETFVFRDAIGATFVDELSNAARRGVQVHMLLDWLGSRTMDRHLLAAARAAGCDLQIYHPPSWYHLGRLNNRTHRKLLVVDGKIGFTGGVGMGVEWRDGCNGLPPWRETHFKAEGPVVAQMQAVFIDNWIKATGRVLHGAEYFPEALRHLRRHGSADVRQLAGRRLREHAPHGAAGAHRGEDVDRHRRTPTSCRTSSPSKRCARRRAVACACASSCPAATPTRASGAGRRRDCMAHC